MCLERDPTLSLFRCIVSSDVISVTRRRWSVRTRPFRLRHIGISGVIAIVALMMIGVAMPVAALASNGTRSSGDVRVTIQPVVGVSPLCPTSPAATEMTPQCVPHDCYVHPSTDNCNGEDPTATGCDRDAKTVDTETWYNGIPLELRWSPHCKTNWARVSQNLNRSMGPGVWVTYGDSDPLGSRMETFKLYKGGGRVWSLMLYAPHNCVTAWLGVNMPPPASGFDWVERTRCV